MRLRLGLGLQGAAEIVSHCIVNKQMASDSRYIICPLPDCDWLIKMPSIIWFGSTSVDIGAAYLISWDNVWKSQGGITQDHV